MLMRLQLHSFNWTGKASILLAEIQFQELLYKDWLRCQKHSADKQFSAGGMRFCASFIRKCSFCDNSLFISDYYTMFLNLNPINHQKPFLKGISFFKAHRALRWNLWVKSEVRAINHDFMSLRSVLASLILVSRRCGQMFILL